MPSQDLLAPSYRTLVLVDHPVSEIERRWNQVCSSEPSLWERLEIRDQALWLKLEKQKPLRLAGIGPDDLPELSKDATALGRWMARHSLFARIVSARVGKEEVTFYALLNQAHGRGFDARLDRWLLNVGHAPLCYRRQKVVELIRRALLELVRQPAAGLAFLDIGSGGGFDGLDVHRICAALPAVRCKIINIDIDEKWLANNELVASAVGAEGFIRHRASIFDYLRNKGFEKDLEGISDLIICCNGFADFLQDQALQELLDGIRQIIRQVPGRVRFVFAAALQRNRLQTSLSRLVGFNYAGRTAEAVRQLLGSSLGEYQVGFKEGHSQILCWVRKG